MCGICGIINLKDEIAPDPELIKIMMGSLTHRGPDSSGYYRDRQVAIGHTRLAIIDLHSGSQPLSNENETIWITFNGEIYNYIELRDELISKGHIFKTKSDTETIVHAWEEWGETCFNRFNGQWALALWDSKNKTMILSRDRHGIRPLYYTVTNTKILFASEVKAIFMDSSIERGFSPEGFSELFTFWSTVAPMTAYKGIMELEPGHFAVIKGNKITSRPYWSINFSENPQKKPDINESAEQLRELLINASKLRFERSDVPVGAYLSGGIDSSITSAIVSQYTDTKLKTFSLRFKENEFDEGNYQNEMSKRLGTDHEDIVVSHEDIGKVFPEVIKHTERPILRTAPAPLYLLSKLVRENGYKVVVTGEGADEVLAGYDIFREAKVRRLIAENPDSLKNAGLINQLYPWMERAPGNTPAFARAFFGKDLDLQDSALSHRPRWNTSSAIKGLFNPEFKTKTDKYNGTNTLLSRLPDNFKNWKNLSKAQWFEYTTLLSGYILSAQGDRMLMANSVEGRFPFLDYNLVEFVNDLPAEFKLKGLEEKHILKKAFADLIPESILNRPKQPYRAPDAMSFFSGKKLDWMEEITDSNYIKEAGIFNPAAIEKLITKAVKRKGEKMSNSDNMRIVGFLSTMLSYKYYIRGENLNNILPPQPMKVIERV